MSKNNIVDEMGAAVRKAASKVGAVARDVAGKPASTQLHEKVVPIPNIDVYSELPFSKIESEGRRTEPTRAPKSRGSSKKVIAKKIAKKSTKKAAKR